MPTVAMWAVIASIVWKVVGFGMLLFVAAIQAIPREINEATMVDGASYWQRVRRITLPLTARTILLVTLVSVIGSLLAFDQFYIMTAGQPRNLTATSVFFVYLNSFPYLKLGYGAALSLILAAIILACTVVQMSLTRRSHALSARPDDRMTAQSDGAPTRGAASRALWTEPRRKYLVGAICIVALHRHAAAARRLGARLAQDDRGGRRGAADLLPARASASTATQRLWNYQAGLPTYLFNSVGTAFLTIAVLPRR